MVDLAVQAGDIYYSTYTHGYIIITDIWKSNGRVICGSHYLNKQPHIYNAFSESVIQSELKNKIWFKICSLK